jgi:hypothetical protein
MEHFEKLIPLAVLMGVAAFLVALLRRATRENSVVEPWREVAVKPAAVAVEARKEEIRRAIPPVEPAAAPKPVRIEPKAAAPPKRAKPKLVIEAAPTKTPIHGVLDLLRQKDTLVTAFLLREILGPPVSRRK